MKHPYDEIPWLPIIVFSLLLILWFSAMMVIWVNSTEGDEHMSAHALVVKELQMEEGFRSKPYKDTTGNWTIGYGHNLEGRSFNTKELWWLFKNQTIPQNTEQYVKYWTENPMSQDHAEYILDVDIMDATYYTKIVYKHVWNEINDERKAALIDLMFNLGYNKYRKFKKHIAATKELDWEKSADEVLDSRAAKQNKRRYQDIAKRLRGTDDTTTEKTL